ncbi:MAG: hypothetical protein AB1498_01645 [bacterium]
MERKAGLWIDHKKAVIVFVSGEGDLIFGPGEAKNELKKGMEKENLSKIIVGLQTADKMTERQIAAKTKKYFQK